jgi:hypothetical protein
MFPSRDTIKEHIFDNNSYNYTSNVVWNVFYLDFFSMIDYYAAQLARQQQQEREHAAQLEAAQRQQAAQQAAQRAQQQQQQLQQQQQQQIIQAQQPAQPVGIRVFFYFLFYI